MHPPILTPRVDARAPPYIRNPHPDARAARKNRLWDRRFRSLVRRHLKIDQCGLHQGHLLFLAEGGATGRDPKSGGNRLLLAGPWATMTGTFGAAREGHRRFARQEERPTSRTSPRKAKAGCTPIHLHRLVCKPTAGTPNLPGSSAPCSSIRNPVQLFGSCRNPVLKHTKLGKLNPTTSGSSTSCLAAWGDRSMVLRKWKRLDVVQPGTE